MKVSICIPTYNRAKHLQNCLQSINIAAQHLDESFKVEICISDNCSSDATEDVVRRANLTLPVKYCRNKNNLGLPRNFLNVVNMAEGDFAWLVGDDDLLMPDALVRLSKLIDAHPTVDFFYVNAFHLTTAYVLSHSQPFNTVNLPTNMTPFSRRLKSGECKFLDLIDQKVSFDFLGGMFLAVFRRCKWEENQHMLQRDAIADLRTFSHFDNTFPHVKIFAYAFSKSIAYFNAYPIIVCLTGAREWAPLQSMIMSVRLIEALELYRKTGLGFLRYLKCRNYALRNFLPHMAWMFLHPKISGLRYVKLNKMILGNLMYPNFYLSPFNYGMRKLSQLYAKETKS
jgi:glycosyltransferase involved in cell wall biosynthesis